MKKELIMLLSLFISYSAIAQNGGKKDVFTKANNTINKANTVLSVFQPYLLKARQIFYDAKQLTADVKKSTNTLLDKKNDGYTNDNSNGYNNNSNTNNSNSGSSTTYSTQTGGTDNLNNSGGQFQTNPNDNTGYSNNYGNDNPGPQNYLPGQNLPVNDPATINNDGTGNWGNQNNGLYGNCLDVLTGTIMGLGEAETNPKSVDVIFIAANGSYQLWTPDYARNQVAAQYTSRSTYESVSKWSDANETEIALTHLTSGQFDKIQNNSQILNAVKNAQNYASSLTEFGKLDGKVFAVKAELEDRTVYGLIEVVKHYGTEGSNGYLKIQIKAQGIDNNQNGQLNASLYQR